MFYRKCPGCGELVTFEDELCPNCSFDLKTFDADRADFFENYSKQGDQVWVNKYKKKLNKLRLTFCLTALGLIILQVLLVLHMTISPTFNSQAIEGTDLIFFLLALIDVPAFMFMLILSICSFIRMKIKTCVVDGFTIALYLADRLWLIIDGVKQDKIDVNGIMKGTLPNGRNIIVRVESTIDTTPPFWVFKLFDKVVVYFIDKPNDMRAIYN